MSQLSGIMTNQIPLRPIKNNKVIQTTLGDREPTVGVPFQKPFQTRRILCSVKKPHLTKFSIQLLLKLYYTLYS